MTNTFNYAKQELDILVESNPDPENRPIIEEFIPEILNLCEKFGNSGQSGASAPFTATALSQAIKKLCLQEPICPITGIDSEWNLISETDQTYQNNRCSALFKVGKNGKPYYIYAIAWKTQKNTCWSGSALLKNGENIQGQQFVKSFPFTPKTFYIDVIEKEISPDNWELYIKDEKQLKAVEKYYDLKITKNDNKRRIR